MSVGHELFLTNPANSRSTRESHGLHFENMCDNLVWRKGDNSSRLNSREAIEWYNQQAKIPMLHSATRCNTKERLYADKSFPF